MSPKRPAFNPFTPEFRADPYAVYDHLREHEPVHKSFIGCWVLSRYADVSAALRDKRLGADRRWERYAARYAKSGGETARALGDLQRRWLVFSDPPDHTRLRSLIGSAFTPDRMAGMKTRVTALARERLAAGAAAGKMDLIADLALPLPVQIISEMLGVPPELTDQLKQWSLQLGRTFDPVLAAPEMKKGLAAAQAFAGLFERLVAERRKMPGDDLVSALIAAGEGEDRLSDEEIIANCVFLYGAGHETTTNTIGNGLLALLHSPEQLAALRQSPQGIPAAAEEMLRFDSPVQLTTRVAREALQLGELKLSAGEEVMLLIGSANRDPAEFPEPDAFNVARKPNRHLAFGQGIHACLGAVLGRVQAQAVLTAVLERELRLEEAAPPRREHVVLRGLERLPVSLA